MTQEEAERRKTEEGQRPGEYEQPTSAENLHRPSAAGTDGRRSDTLVHSPPMSPEVEKTMRKAQKQTDKATPAEKGRSGSEEEKPERTLRTAEEPRSSALLPVVQEAGESGEQNDIRATSPASAKEKADHELPHSTFSTSSSIPGLRKVSPSTVATATDIEDDTSLSSPQVMDFEPLSQIGDGPIPEPATAKSFERAPRIGSDLIQPQSPLGETVLKSLNEHLGHVS